MVARTINMTSALGVSLLIALTACSITFAQGTTATDYYNTYGNSYQPGSTEANTNPQNTQETTGYESYGNYGVTQNSQGNLQGEVHASGQAGNNTNTQPSALEQPLQAYIDIKQSQTDIREYSKKKYEAYEIEVNNTSPHHVELLQAQVVNGLDEQMLAANKAEEKKKKKRGFGAMMKAASIGAGVAGHFVPYGGGTGAYYTGRALSQASYATNSVANAANYSANADGNVVITGQYHKQVSNVVVSPGNKMSFQVVVPKGTQPSLAFVVKDLTTNQIVDIKK